MNEVKSFLENYQLTKPYDIKELGSFLESYNLLETEVVTTSFFEIIAFNKSHYEYISSNVLKHYLRNRLILQAFLSCLPNKVAQNVGHGILVEREVITDIKDEDNDKKRLDLVISTNKYLIGIENKIKAPLDNPLDIYYSYLQKRAKEEEKEFALIVLSLNEVKPKNEYSHIPHINILHTDFGNEVKKHYSKLVNQLEYRDFLFLNEYINNIERLKGESMMNKEFLELAGQEGNLEKIWQIRVEANRLRDDFKGIAARIVKDCKNDKNSYEYPLKDEDIAARGYTHNILGFACFELNSEGEYFSFKEEEYHTYLLVEVSALGFTIDIAESNGNFDSNFKELITAIMPNLSQNFKIVNDIKHSNYEVEGKYVEASGYRYKEIIALNDYDKLIAIVQEILDNFDKNASAYMVKSED